MNRLPRVLILVAALALAAPASAQIFTVPMMGAGNEWVKRLDLKGRMDWEWIETYPDRVFFATRHDSRREGDIVTMWMRIEYKEPVSPGPHRSAVSRDDWDCANKRRANVGTFFYRWNNLEGEDPDRSTAFLKNWEKIEPQTLAWTLWEFACSIQPTQELVAPDAKEPGKP